MWRSSFPNIIYGRAILFPLSILGYIPCTRSAPMPDIFEEQFLSCVFIRNFALFCNLASYDTCEGPPLRGSVVKIWLWCRRQRRRGFDPWVKKIHWRRAWQPTPAFLPGKSHGQRSLVGYVCRVAKSWTQLKRVNTQAHGTSLEAKKSLLMFHMYPSM